MFYYYQLRNHHYITDAQPLLLCPLCLSAGGMHISIMQKYYWMIGPMVPSAKYAISWCEHCSNYIPKVKWSDEMDLFYARLKKGVKTPYRLYRGLWVTPLILVTFIGVLFFSFSISNTRQQSKAAAVKEAILHPHPGDIFQVIHSADGTAKYTYFKVDHISGDSLYLLPSSVVEADMRNWDHVPTASADYKPVPITVSISQTAAEDMFTWGENNHDYGLIYGAYKEGELIKKY